LVSNFGNTKRKKASLELPRNEKDWF